MIRTLAHPYLSVDAAVAAHREKRLTASRARVAAAADETRRRLQRDLHRGAQARLAHTVVALKLARDALAAGRSPADLIDEEQGDPHRPWKGFVNPFNPCLPHVKSRTCKRIVSMDERWAPFNPEDEYYLIRN